MRWLLPRTTPCEAMAFFAACSFVPRNCNLSMWMLQSVIRWLFRPDVTQVLEVAKPMWTCKNCGKVDKVKKLHGVVKPNPSDHPSKRTFLCSSSEEAAYEVARKKWDSGQDHPNTFDVWCENPIEIPNSSAGLSWCILPCELVRRSCIELLRTWTKSNWAAEKIFLRFLSSKHRPCAFQIYIHAISIYGIIHLPFPSHKGPWASAATTSSQAKKQAWFAFVRAVWASQIFNMYVYIYIHLFFNIVFIYI